MWTTISLAFFFVFLATHSTDSKANRMSVPRKVNEKREMKEKHREIMIALSESHNNP